MIDSSSTSRNDHACSSRDAGVETTLHHHNHMLAMNGNDNRGKYHNQQAGAAPTNKPQESLNEAVNQHHQYQARSDLMQPVAHPTIK